MQIPGMPDFSGAQRIMAGAAPEAPTPVGKNEKLTRWLGALAQGGGQGLQQMNLASVLTGAGGAGAQELAAIDNQARRAEQLFQTQRARHGQARALMEVSISDRQAQAEALRGQAMFKNDLMRYSQQRERDKLLTGGVQFVGNQMIKQVYNPETNKMDIESIQMNQVDTFLNMMKIQATFAAGKGKGNLQAGTYEIAMSMFQNAPHMVVPATLAALTVSGVIGGDLQAMFQQKVEAHLDEMGLDHKMLRQQEGEDGYRKALDRMLFNVIMQDITGPGGDALFQQLFSESQGNVSFRMQEE
jgi:hypothetical protein